MTKTEHKVNKGLRWTMQNKLNLKLASHKTDSGPAFSNERQAFGFSTTEKLLIIDTMCKLVVTFLSYTCKVVLFSLCSNLYCWCIRFMLISCCFASGGLPQLFALLLLCIVSCVWVFWCCGCWTIYLSIFIYRSIYIFAYVGALRTVVMAFVCYELVISNWLKTKIRLKECPCH